MQVIEKLIRKFGGPKMPFYRKKPVVVDAEQFTHPATAPSGVYVGENGECYVVTMHLQKVYLEPGDWIIKEPDGAHYYPCKDEVFKATYDKL
jgi:hypothetical protein